jgi:hypothetical protein
MDSAASSASCDSLSSRSVAGSRTPGGSCSCSVAADEIVRIATFRAPSRASPHLSGFGPPSPS